ncbi:MAG TPA: PIG-L family deacetylase [bacterium]|nr:PIG-L family deacetylase [bacterium]
MATDRRIGYYAEVLLGNPTETGSKTMPHVLAIHAHPDDIEILAAGTVALLTRHGWTAEIITMAPGDCGTADRSAMEISVIRRKEATNSAAVIGARYRCMEERDLRIYHNDRTQEKVTEAIRASSPDIVITGSPQDYMSDHEYTSLLVRNACFNAPIKNYDTHAENQAPTSKSIPTLYYADPIEGINLFGEPIIPHIYVDITETLEIKRKMLACHESQRNWLRAHHGVDEYLLAMERAAKKRGEEVGLQFAEGFRQHRGHGFPKKDLLKEVLGDLVRSPK